MQSVNMTRIRMGQIADVRDMRPNSYSSDHNDLQAHWLCWWHRSVSTHIDLEQNMRPGYGSVPMQTHMAI